MNKKSFLRGFGIGVLFSVLVLGISFSIRTSDTEVIHRARDLGMSFKAEDEEKAVETEKPTVAPGKETPSVKSEENKQPESTEKADTSSKTKNNDENFKKQKKEMQSSLSSEKQKLTIKDGEWSTQVSEKLKNMGIIDDAKAFDKFLDDNGYSSDISIGDYTVKKGETYDELAKKITGKE